MYFIVKLLRALPTSIEQINLLIYLFNFSIFQTQGFLSLNRSYTLSATLLRKYIYISLATLETNGTGGHPVVEIQQ